MVTKAILLAFIKLSIENKLNKLESNQ